MPPFAESSITLASRTFDDDVGCGDLFQNDDGNTHQSPPLYAEMHRIKDSRLAQQEIHLIP